MHHDLANVGPGAEARFCCCKLCVGCGSGSPVSISRTGRHVRGGCWTLLIPGSLPQSHSFLQCAGTRHLHAQPSRNETAWRAPLVPQQRNPAAVIPCNTCILMHIPYCKRRTQAGIPALGSWRPETKPNPCLPDWISRAAHRLPVRRIVSPRLDVAWR